MVECMYNKQVINEAEEYINEAGYRLGILNHVYGPQEQRRQAGDAILLLYILIKLHVLILLVKTIDPQPL